MKPLFKTFALCSAFAAACLLSAEEKSFELPESAAGYPGEGEIRQSDWFKEMWKSQRTKFDSLKTRDHGAVVFLGDSITQGWGNALWAAFPEMKVANRGISGDTTRGLIIRIQEDVLDLAPTAIVLLIGTNDLGIGIPPEAIARNMQILLDSIKRSTPNIPVILCEVFPSSIEKKRPVEKINTLNSLYMQLAKGDPQIIYMDTYDLFANESGDAKPSEFPDLLHPNEIGYAKWAAALRPIFATHGFMETQDAFALEDGYKPLFDGKSLDGWCYLPSPESDIVSSARWKEKGPQGAAAWPIVKERANFDGLSQTPDGRYLAKHGKLTVSTPSEIRKIQRIWTQEEFDQDFILKLEFRATPQADSGIFIRGPQLQCRDYHLAGPWKDLKNYKPQEWNEIVITVKENTAHCTCNGEVLIDAFELPDSGPIGLEGDRGQVEYRNIRIKTQP
ncbi:GDSL-type esterase/lipase family protein [Puniceicoccaceae bacterium K14]|nr:GDSL-type esterase/lipase family protein [Puniceicoccaceae bacterium K14]